MTIRVLCVGKTNQPFVADGLAEFKKRLTHYAQLEWIELSDVRHGSALQPPTLKKAEAEAILSHIIPSDVLVLLDEGGKQMTSEELASWLQEITTNRMQRLTLAIGGAYGFHQSLYDRAQQKISMSKLTFSHQLVRLILAEQLYRACTIMRGEPYHHR